MNFMPQMFPIENCIQVSLKIKQHESIIELHGFKGSSKGSCVFVVQDMVNA